MRVIEVAEFKKRCVELLDNLEPEGLLITRHGRPLASLVPYERGSSRLIGSLRDKIEIKGDLLCTGVFPDPDAGS